MEVVLTGSTGFLGGILYKEFCLNHNVITLGRGVSNSITVDLATDDPSAFCLPGNYAIVHAAGKAHVVPKSEAERTEFWNVNLIGTKRLCKILESSGNLPKSFVFISTVSVYGIERGENISEDTPLSGVSDYAKSKIEAENWLSLWAQMHGIPLLIFRLPLIAGPNPPGNLGSMIQGIKNRKYFRIGKGDAKKSIVLATDVADIILKSLGMSGIYNLTDGYHPSFYELEKIIAAQFGENMSPSIPLFFGKCAAKVGDIVGNKSPINSSRLSKITSTLTFDDTKAREVLGWNPHRVLGNFKIY